MKKNVIIVGAGLGGTLLCNTLAETGKVTLLEAGEKERISYPPVKFTNKPLAAVKTFCFGGGGTTNLWHNGLIPIQSEDVTSADFLQALNNSRECIDQSAAMLFWLDHPFNGEYKHLSDQIKNLPGLNGVFRDGIDCLLYPKKYRKLQADKRVNAFYSVNNIEFISNGKFIHSVRFNIGNKAHTIDADIIIISAGALGSPLLVKKVLAALGHPSDDAGRGFMDHPIGFIGKVKFKKSLNKSIRQLALWDKGNYECRTAIRIKSACGQYTSAAFLRPALTMENNLSISKYKSLLGASSGLDRFKHVFSPKLFHPDILAEIYAHLFSKPIPGRVYNVLFVFEQKRGQNRITYNGNTIEVDWRITEEELAIYKQAIEKLGLMLTDIADEINFKSDITEDWLWSHAHHSGTISMGSNSHDLVDQDLKLRAGDNVFVCDGSIIQEHSYANTGLTIGALALRLAERVLK